MITWSTLPSPVLHRIAEYDVDQEMARTCRAWSTGPAQVERQACNQFIDWLDCSSSLKQEAKTNLEFPRTLKIVRALAAKILPELIAVSTEPESFSNPPFIPRAFAQYGDLRAFFLQDYDNLDKEDKIGFCCRLLEKGFIQTGMRRLLDCKMKKKLFIYVVDFVAKHVGGEVAGELISQQVDDLQWRGFAALQNMATNALRNGSLDKAASAVQGLAIEFFLKDSYADLYFLQKHLNEMIIIPLNLSGYSPCEIAAARLSEDLYEWLWILEHSAKKR